jgi:outer membrane receptor protein involved in Fe transport
VPISRFCSIGAALTFALALLAPQFAYGQTIKTIFPQVSGVVRTGAGAPVAGATVQLRGPQTLTAHTDSGGLFSIANVPPATYNVTVSAKGYNDATRTVAILNEDLTLGIVLTATSNLKQIASVSVNARGSINVTAAPSYNATPVDMAEQGQTQWSKVLEEIPGVSVTTPGGFTGASVPGNPVDSQVVSIRGALPYETAMLIDNMPMYGVTAGLYTGNGLDLASYNPQAFSSFDVVSGPGAQSPTVVGSIGGSLNLHPAGQVNGTHYDFSIANDPYGGLIGTNSLQVHTGNLSATLTYDFDNSPGPIYQIPIAIDGSDIYKINGQSFACGANCAWAPGFPNNTAGPFYNSQTGGFIACCITNPNSQWSTHDESASIFYQFSRNIIGQFFFSDTNGFSTLTNGFVPTTFTPPAGYTGSFPAGTSNQMLAGTAMAPTIFQPETQIFEGKFTFQLGQGQLQIAALSNISAQNEVGYNPTGPVSLNLYGGGAFYTNPGVSPATNPVVFNGQAATVNYFETNILAEVRGDNRDYSANYTLPLGENARATASFVHSYFGYSVPETIQVGLPDGTGGQFPLSLSFPAQNNYQQTDQTRVGFGISPPNSHLSADASVYFTNSSWHVINPADLTASTYVTQSVTYDAPRISLVWRPKADFAVRAAAGGGIAIAPIAYLVGTNNAPICEPPSGCFQTQVNLNLKPETSWGYDLGLDKKLGDNSILSADIYTTTLWGQLYNFSNTGPPCPSCGGLPLTISQYENLAQTKYAGLELDVKHNVPHGYMWSASLSFMRGYVSSLPPGFYNSGGTCDLSTGVNCATGAASVLPGINFNGSFTNANVPYAQGFGLVGYRWKPHLFVAADMHYFGNNNGYYVPAFVVFDLNAEYPVSAHASLQVTFRNITNQNAEPVANWANGTIFPTAFGPNKYYIAIPYGPKTVLVTFHLHG